MKKFTEQEIIDAMNEVKESLLDSVVDLVVSNVDKHAKIMGAQENEKASMYAIPVAVMSSAVQLSTEITRGTLIKLLCNGE